MTATVPIDRREVLAAVNEWYAAEMPKRLARFNALVDYADAIVTGFGDGESLPAAAFIDSILAWCNEPIAVPDQIEPPARDADFDAFRAYFEYETDRIYAATDVKVRGFIDQWIAKLFQQPRTLQ